MRILADQNISHRLVTRLEDLKIEFSQVRLLGLEDSTDREIWEYARDNDYSILTFDADFYDFSLVWGHPPKIIWIRTGNQTTAQVEKVLRAHDNTIQEFHSDPELACLEIVTAADNG